MTDSPSDRVNREQMPLPESLAVLARLRSDEIVVTSMNTTREWPRLGDHPLDFHYLPSSMGGAVSVALGLALAQPARHVIVFSGDGSLLMNLGSLVTAVASGATNLTIILIDNGVYEVTGVQPTPAKSIPLDYARIAAACGFPSYATFSDLDSWKLHAAEQFATQGPRFITLVTEPVTAEVVPGPLPPVRERIEKFQSALRSVESLISPLPI